jgi:hypothetical protein
VLLICSLPCVLLFLWLLVIAPHLLALLQPLEDTAPVTRAVLRGLVVFGVLPWSLVPPFIVLCFYQRRYDREKRDVTDSAA